MPPGAFLSKDFPVPTQDAVLRSYYVEHHPSIFDYWDWENGLFQADSQQPVKVYSKETLPWIMCDIVCSISSVEAVAICST